MCQARRQYVAFQVDGDTGAHALLWVDLGGGEGGL